MYSFKDVAENISENILPASLKLNLWQINNIIVDYHHVMYSKILVNIGIALQLILNRFYLF